jgi:ferritin
MDLSSTLLGMINEQIVNELHNANVYSQISSWFGNFNLDNLRDKFQKQAEDERSHADRFISFLQDRIGGNVRIGAVAPITEPVGSLQEIAQSYVDLEKLTTKRITAILSQALADGDHMSYKVLQWFIEEQYAEENEAMEFLNKATMISEGGRSALVLWDTSLE